MTPTTITPSVQIGTRPIDDWFDWLLDNGRSLYLCKLRYDEDVWGLQILVNSKWEEGQYEDIFDSFEAARTRINETDWSQTH
jgi:hypothetical protein